MVSRQTSPGPRGPLLLLAMVLVACGTAAERLGDFDGDGRADVLLRHVDGSWRYHGSPLSGLRGQPVRLTRKEEWYWTGVGDFNGDGSDDVLMRRTDGVWVYYPMTGSRVLAEERGWANLTRNLDWRVAGVGDFNRDGSDDVLMRRTDGAWVYYPMDGRRVMADGSGWTNLPRETTWRMAGVGDFDGDGEDDVLLRHAGAGKWRWYAMSGRRVVGHHEVPGLPEALAWRFLAVGDFDHDKHAEVLLRHADGRWRRQVVCCSRRDTVEYDGDWSWRFVGVGDVDGTGTDDVLARHRDGRWRLDLMEEDTQRSVATALPTDPSYWRVPSPAVRIPDPNLSEAVLDALRREPGEWLRRHELAELMHLRAEDSAIADLTGLEDATGLRTLELERNDVEDASPLMGLVELADVDLGRNRIADLTPFSGLDGLAELALSRNRVRNVAPLSTSAALRRLYLFSNTVSDISPLASLTDLDFLYLSGNPIEDLSPLSRLTGLTRLYLGNTGHKDFSALAGLTRLEDLSLVNNGVTDISPLADMNRLHFVLLGGNEIRDLSPLSGAVDIVTLNLQQNLIEDISPLASVTGLQYLYLDWNRIRRLTALAGLRNLRVLQMRGNRIRNVAPLAGLQSLERLLLGHNEIEDISSVADLHALSNLGLEHNAIVDIAAVSGLTALEELDLSYNRIADLSPLVDNDGLDDGDRVDVRGNPLTEAAFETAVPALRARGVAVEVGARARLDGVHDDSVVVLRVEEDIAALDLYSGLPLDEYSAVLYRHFEDAFDFVMFFSNLDDIRDHEHSHYYGVYSSVRNDTEGIGVRRFYDNRYGSEERLKGVIHFPYNRALLFGPALHEMLHAWANYSVPSAVGGHWGFSSADGQLGGFDIANLVEFGDGRYAAGEFGTFANGGNRPPYSPIELYFAGYLPPEEVPDLFVAADGEWVVEDGETVLTEDGQAIFSASDVRTLKIEDIVADHGPRIPSMADAQWHFRVAIVLLTDDAHPATEEQLSLLGDHVSAFSLPGDDGRHPHNFYEATGGRGSVAMGGLSEFRKTAPGAVRDLPTSYGVVPEPFASVADGRCVRLSTLGPAREAQ